MKFLKSLLLFLTLACAALPLTALGADRGAVAILVDGVPLEAAGDAYINGDGVTMVPLRALSEALGFAVSWDGESRTVSVASEPAPLTSAVVVLDPGHGGESTGADYGGAAEKDLNLAIAAQAAALLEEEGVTVHMTRTEDGGVPLCDRTALAEAWEADLFVSVHCNASVTNPEAKGIYTCAYDEAEPGWALAEGLREAMCQAAGAEDMGTEARPDLAVLRTATMPAALVECGYMSTPEELALLVQPEYQAKLARGIANGILAYLAPARQRGRILERQTLPTPSGPQQPSGVDAVF